MTLEEVARRAKVSTATVSRVLNSTGLVRETTRKRVLQAVKELKYYPNLHARTLAHGKSDVIGMIVSNIQNPFFVDIFVSLESAASQRGYQVLLEHTDYRSTRLVSSVRSMLGRRLAGLAVIVSEMEPSLMEELTHRGLPVVFYDVGRSTRNIQNIRVRYEVGVKRTVEYLYSLGHRRMAFAGHHAGLSPLQVRRKTFLDTMETYADQVSHTTVETTDSPSGGRQAVRLLLDRGFTPSAILCVNDYMAIGVLRELEERGLRVPQDVSVTGFDNIELSEFTHPTLTTVDIPRRVIGQMAFDALVLEAPAEQAFGAEIVIEPELVVRQSTGPARQAY